MGEVETLRLIPSEPKPKTPKKRRRKRKEPKVNDYQVYIHRDPRDGLVFYIGEGRGGRPWAITSRTEHHIERLNELFANGYHMGQITEVRHNGLTKEEALDIEAILIDLFDLRTLQNKSGGRTLRKAGTDSTKGGGVRAEITQEFIQSLGPVDRATDIYGEYLRVTQYSTGRISFYVRVRVGEEMKTKHITSIDDKDSVSDKELTRIRRLHRQAVNNFKQQTAIQGD